MHICPVELSAILMALGTCRMYWQARRQLC